MDARLRASYTAQLVRDREKKFDDEFLRTTDLERAILDEHGEDGARFLLERMGLSLAIDDVPPWPIDGLAPSDAVRKIFGPVREQLPEFIEALEERVRWVIPAKRKSQWVLTYMRSLYDGRRYYEVIFGGPPNPTPTVSQRAASLGWTVPTSIARLYRVHDAISSTGGGLVASSDLVDLGELMDPIAEEQHFIPRGYRFQDLLEFYPDGAGNCQSLHRRRKNDADPPTVDWDHETREISDEMPFFEFADEALSREVLDEE